MTSPRRLLSTVVFGFALLAFASAARAQYPGYLTNNNDTGLPNYGSFISSSIDSVNLSNGGLIIRIPFASRKDRSMGYTTGFQYDSKYWVVNRTYYPYPQMPQNTAIYNWYTDQFSGGWRRYSDTGGIGAGYDYNEQLYTCTPSDERYPPMQVAIRSNYYIQDETGAKHQVPLRKIYTVYQHAGTYCPDGFASTPQNMKAESDTGQWQLDITNETYPINLATGTWQPMVYGIIRSINGVQANVMVDTNGNGCCVLPVPGNSTHNTGNPNIQAFDYTDSNGNTQTILITWTTISGQPSFPTTSCSPYGGCQFAQGGMNLTVIQKIQLPNGLSYTFSYIDPATGQTNPYGEVMKITLPTGGYVRYKWATIAQRDLGPMEPPNGAGFQLGLDARVVTERHVSEDGTNEKVWTYSYAGPAGFVQTTTVTDPLGNVAVHTFGGPLEASVVYYQGSSTPVKEVDTAWGMDTGPVTIDQPVQDEYGDYPAVLNPVNRNFRVAGTITTLMDTNQVTQTQTDYGDCYTYNIFPSGTTVLGGNTFTECRAVPTETREYDFGTGASGALLRKTDVTYLHQSNSTYLNAHMWTLATLKTVKDGTGNVVAQASTTYDSTTLASSGGTAINHDYTNYSTSNTLRGNPTVVSRWLNTTSTWLTTTNYFDDLGNLYQTTDPGGHTYTLYYTDNFTDGVDHHTQAFLTHVVSPTTSNGVSHIEGKQYFYNTGLTAAVCGQNYPTPATCSFSAGLPASDYARYTYDLLGRPLTVTHGDSGTTSFTFTEPASPSPTSRINVSSSSAIDSSQNLTNSAVIDGLGRVIQTKLTSDPDGVDSVETTFDEVGRKHTVSNPHRGTGASTDGITTYNYDGLGRVTTLIPPDGTSTSNNVSTAYSGNTVTVTDQAGKQRRSVTDGLGRLIEVDEPGAPPSGSGVTASNGFALVTGTLQTWGAAGHGTVTISGSEGTAQIEQDPTCETYDEGGNCTHWSNNGMPTWITVYDSGSVSVTANGRTKTVGYGASSTASALASALASAINGDSLMSVTASANGALITLTAKTHGAATNYSLSGGSWTNDPADFSGGPSFYTTPSGAALIGGVTDFQDTGTVWVNIGGTQVSVTFGSGSTASTIATALASAINGNSSFPVTASASSGAVNLTEKTQGSSPSLSAGSTTNYPSTFAQPSFAVAASGPDLDQTANNVPLSLATPAVTLYFYDTLDNLTCVEQHGNVSGTGCASSPSNDSASPWRVRRFTYDSLGQLLTAKNPESGTSTYTYNSDGNVLTKTDARNIAITYTYDALHRILTKTYSDGTPTASLTYDVSSVWGVTNHNPIGRLVLASTYNTGKASSYDSMGRINQQWQCTPLNCGTSSFALNYGYNFRGEIMSSTNGQGVTISQTFDAAGRVSGITSSLVDSQHPATLVVVDPSNGYSPVGALAKLTFGNGLIETRTYNNRLLPTQLRTYNPASNNADVLNLNYGFTDSNGHNNGNLVSFTSTATQLFMRSYTYDELNRLSTMSSPADASGCNGLKWTYDPWANRLAQTVTSGACLSGSQATSTINRILNTGYSYDVAGNMTQGPDPNSLGTLYYAFDAENRLTNVNNGSTATYVYDADSRRVRKTVSGSSIDYVYDLGGRVVAEVNASGWQTGYVYMGGKLIAQYNNGTTYSVHKDDLGSSRVLTNLSGGVYDSMDYLPYGEPLSGGTSTTHRFTGKERDAESSLDYFGARYYGSVTGRFTSPDEAPPDPFKPQTLNRYTFVLNNPINVIDPDGNFGEPWHQIMTTQTLRAMGFGVIITAEVVAANVSMDALFNDKAHAYMHTQAGDNPDGTRQSPLEAQTAERNYVQGALDAAAQCVLDGRDAGAAFLLGSALHDVQDEKHDYIYFDLHTGSYTNDHKTEEGAFQWDTDVIPKQWQLDYAVARTKQAIQQFVTKIWELGKQEGLSDKEIKKRINNFLNGPLHASTAQPGSLGSSSREATWAAIEAGMVSF